MVSRQTKGRSGYLEVPSDGSEIVFGCIETKADRKDLHTDCIKMVTRNAKMVTRNAKASRSGRSAKASRSDQYR